MGATAIASLAVLIIAAVAGRRWWRVRQSRLAAAVRPILFRALDDGEIDAQAIDALEPAQQRMLEAQARSLLPNLRGQDRDTLARLLERRGAVDAARKQAHSRRRTARASAATFLGEAGSPSAVPDLVELLHDHEPEVRWAAARGLGRLGHASAITPLLSAVEGRYPVPVDLVIETIFEIRDCPVSVLRQCLRSRSVPTRAVGVELLGRFQALAATGDIIDRLHNDPSFEVRARAARALGRIGSPRAIEPLMSCLDSGPPAVRAQAIWALGELGAPDAVPALRGLLLGPSRQLADHAAKALARTPPAGKSILLQVSESDTPAGMSARQALADLDHDGARPAPAPVDR